MAALALFALGGTALAGRDWCARDPILVFADGTRVQWVTSLPADELGALTGPVTFRFTLPSNAGPVTVLFPQGSTGERVVISYSGSRWDGRGGLPVQTRVFVGARDDFEYATTVSGNVSRVATFEGESNETSNASLRVDRERWYPLVDASVIAYSFSVSRDAAIDIP
jgi:hypothetical protein